jgi:hypothetical protein
VATTLLLVFLAAVAEAQEEKKAPSTNTRAYCRKGCGKSPAGRCKKQSGTWTCVGECRKGFARSASSSALCDACAGGYASSISPLVPAWVASGFPSCTSTPCKRGCTQCPPGTVSPGGLIGPLGTSNGAVCLSTGATNWTQLITTTPDMSQIPQGPARCLPGGDALLQQFLAASLYAQGAQPGSVQVKPVATCTIVQTAPNTYLAKYEFSLAYQGDPSIYANIQKAIASSGIDVSTFTGGICSAYTNAKGTSNICQAFVASTPKGYIITNQGTGSDPNSALTGTMSLGLVLASTEGCSDALTTALAGSIRESFLAANPLLSNETSASPGGCSEVALNESSYAVANGMLYVYALGQTYQGQLTGASLKAFEGGTLKIKGVNDGTRRLLGTGDDAAQPGDEDAVDVSGALPLDDDTVQTMARSLLQLKAPRLVSATTNVFFIYVLVGPGGVQVTAGLVQTQVSGYIDAAKSTLGVTSPLAQITGNPNADQVAIQVVLARSGSYVALLVVVSFSVVNPVPVDAVDNLSVFMGIKTTNSPTACTEATVQSLATSLRASMVAQSQYSQVTVTMQSCTQSGSFAVYRCTFGWVGRRATQDNFIRLSAQPFGPCNLLSSGCQSWSQSSGQDVLCVNDDGSGLPIQCPANCATGLWRAGQGGPCNFVLGGYFYSGTAAQQCAPNSFSTSAPPRAISAPAGQSCTPCPPGTNSPAGATSCTGQPPATSAPAGFYIDGLGQNQPCPGAYTAPWERQASDPTSKFCFPPTNFVGSRYYGSTTKNRIAYQALSTPAGARSIGCPDNTALIVVGSAAACATCPDGYTGAGCNNVQPGWYGDRSGGGAYAFASCPGDSSSGDTNPSTSIPKTAGPEVCTTCRAGYRKTAAGTCEQCLGSTTGLPGGIDLTCGYCMIGTGGAGCSSCGANFATVGMSYATPAQGCDANTAGCAAGKKGSTCNLDCGIAAPADVFSGRTPSGAVGYVEAVDGQTCTIGCRPGTGLSPDGSSCVACGSNQYSPGAAAYPDNLYAWPRCITCPPGTTSTGSRCVLTATASAAALFDEFD